MQQKLRKEISAAKVRQKKTLQKVWNDLGRIWEGFGKVVLRFSGFFELFAQFDDNFPTLGKGGLVVLAHANPIHPSGVVVHERQCAVLADILVAALVVDGDIQFEFLDSRTELLGIHGVVAHPSQIPVYGGPLPFGVDHSSFAHASLERLCHLLVVVGIALVVELPDAPFDVTSELGDLLLFQ